MEEDGRGRYVEAKRFHLSVRLHCYTSKQIGVQSCAGDSWRLSDNQALVIDLSLGAPLVQLVVDKTWWTKLQRRLSEFSVSVCTTGAQGLPPNMASCITRRIRAWANGRKQIFKNGHSLYHAYPC